MKLYFIYAISVNVFARLCSGVEVLDDPEWTLLADLYESEQEPIKESEALAHGDPKDPGAEAVTAFYPRTWGWSFTREGEIPFAALLFNYNTTEKRILKQCGGVLITNSHVMTLCLCTYTYLKSLWPKDEDDPQPKTIKKDLKAGVIYLTADTIHIEEAMLGEKEMARLPSAAAEQILGQQQCIDAYFFVNPSYAPDGLRAIAVLKFTPTIELSGPDVPAPWPIAKFSYDDELQKIYPGTRFKFPSAWGKFPGVEYNFQVTSFFFEPVDRPDLVKKDDFNRPINIKSSLLNVESTVCDQEYCALVFPHIQEEPVVDRLRTMVCLCDSISIVHEKAGENDFEKGLDHGLIGSPVIYHGELIGLLSTPFEQRNQVGGKTRSTVVVTFDQYALDYIKDLVPEVEDRIRKIEDFRGPVDVVDYNVFIPEKGFKPEDANIISLGYGVRIIPSLDILWIAVSSTYVFA